MAGLDNTAIDIQQGEDGAVVINLDIARTERKKNPPDKFSANLADAIDDASLATIAQEIWEGVEADKASRSDWVANYNKGLNLLGLKLEDGSDSTGATTSKVTHPLLLWSIVKFQSLAQGELLPSSGPAKVRNDGSLPPEIAASLERSMNHYLTTTAVEYYPDTDQGLFYLGYGGTIYKKVYRCPLRKRPVSECVYLPDLIVSQDAVSLQTAKRVTHRIEMSQQDVARYQRIGYWRDVLLGQPVRSVESTEIAEARLTGIAADTERFQDVPYILWETYTNLDLGRFGLSEKDQADGDELPYRVTMDSYSRQILEIRRNWRQDDQLRRPRKRFIKWSLVPGIGFLSFGFLHLLGNHTRALTALERILIDAGIFSNFPAGVRVKGTRLETNEIRPMPGQFPEIETNGLPINQAIMALPYKGPAQEVMTLLEGLENQGEKMAGQLEVQTGDGRTNVPVGTIMAQIEQASQNMMAIHKRLHQAQSEELQVLRELLCDEPELLYIPGETPKWTPEQLSSASLVPSSDPNVPAHVHRIMQAVALEGLASSHPELYNAYEVQRRILSIARIPDPQEVLIPPHPQPPQTDPMAQLAMMQLQIEQMRTQLQAKEQERKTAEMQLSAAERASKSQNEQLRTMADIKHQQRQDELEEQRHVDEMANAAADRSSREAIAMKNASTQADLAQQEAESQMDLERMRAAMQPEPTTESEE